MWHKEERRACCPAEKFRTKAGTTRSLTAFFPVVHDRKRKVSQVASHWQEHRWQLSLLLFPLPSLEFAMDNFIYHCWKKITCTRCYGSTWKKNEVIVFPVQLSKISEMQTAKENVRTIRERNTLGNFEEGYENSIGQGWEVGYESLALY